MKRYGNLKHIWTNYETLYMAFCEVKKGKNYDPKVIKYEMDLANNLNRLQKSLIDETYRPRPANIFTIKEPKERVIEAPHFEDRIVQHALLIASRSLIEKRFIQNTFACMKGKGTHKASLCLQSGIRKFRDKGYFLKIDIKKFFYSISHKYITQRLEKIIKCKSTINLYKLFYENPSGLGLPLGNVTSQVLANLALTELDHFCKRGLKLKYYFRYMDDIIILAENKSRLKESLREICKVLDKAELQINNKTNIGKIANGIDFVGYKTWFNRRVIRKRSLYNIKKRLIKNPDIQRISSFLSHAKGTNSIEYVINIIVNTVPEKLEFIRTWFKNNIGVNDAILQS